MAECVIGGRLGAHVHLERIEAQKRVSTIALLFGESPSRLLVSVPKRRVDQFRELINGAEGARIGQVTDDGRLSVTRHHRAVLSTGIDQLIAAWHTGPMGARK